VQHRQKQKFYAMKITEKRKIGSDVSLQRAMTERNVLSYVAHPYIVPLLYAFQTSSHLALVMGFCSGSDLAKLVKRERRLSEPLASLYSAEMLLALCYLHERLVIFRDLKPSNVMIDGDGHVQLTGFGVSKEGVTGLRGTRSFCGSAAFLAPEILLRSGHGHAVDIYGLGVLLFVMLSGSSPFYHDDRETLYANICYSKLHIPYDFSNAAASFVSRTMQRDPSQRLGAAQTVDLKGHAFFENLDWEALMRREVPIPVIPLEGSGLGDSMRDSMMRSGLKCQSTILESPHKSRLHTPLKGTGSSIALRDWEFAAL